MAGSQEIYNEYVEQIEALKVAHQKLDDEARAVRSKRYTTPGLSDAQKAAFDAEEVILREQKIDIARGAEELAYTTAERLDKADDLQEMIDELEAVIVLLKGVVKKILRYGEIATAVNGVLGGVNKLKTKIEGLLPQN